MSPSATIISATSASTIVTDRLGRKLTVRHMTSLDKLRLFKAAGPGLRAESALARDGDAGVLGDRDR